MTNSSSSASASVITGKMKRSSWLPPTCAPTLTMASKKALLHPRVAQNKKHKARNTARHVSTRPTAARSGAL